MTWYKTGTVSVTNGSPTVTLASGDALLNIFADDGFVGPDGRTYAILQVNSATQFVLSQDYKGATASGQDYVIIPTADHIQLRDMLVGVNTLIDTYETVTLEAGAGRFKNGTALEPGVRGVTNPDTGLVWNVDGTLGISVNGTIVTTFNGSGMAFNGGPGTIVRTVNEKLREFVSIRDFGAVGDGSADDTVALTAFINHANANPGICHTLDDATYIITSPLPDINVSGAWIRGAGAELHDIGTLMTGTVIKWGGVISPSSTMLRVSSISGAGLARVSNVTIDGIGFDCNYGAVGGGLEVLSVRDCLFNVTVCNASDYGVSFNVVAALGEAKDNQRNCIKIVGRQVESDGFVLVAGGDLVANTSMNELYIDCQHNDKAAIFCTNTDNNDWRFVRCFKVAGGAATESIALLGSNDYGCNARSERFWFLSATVPLHSYGAADYIYPSTGNQIFSLDKENGSPPPIISAGSEVSWRYDSTAMDDNAWKEWIPSVTSLSGALGSVTNAVGYYRKIGTKVDFKINFEIANNGTGSVIVLISLPVMASGGTGQICFGKERALTGHSLTGYIDSGTSEVQLSKYDGSYPGVTGGVYNVSGSYQVAAG